MEGRTPILTRRLGTCLLLELPESPTRLREAFFNVIDWDAVAERYAGATA